MKQYRITIDVTMSGDIYLDADSLTQAQEKASVIRFTPQDLRNFHFLESNIFDSEEVEEETDN